jgi:hypothetical protein
VLLKKYQTFTRSSKYLSSIDIPFFVNASLYSSGQSSISTSCPLTKLNNANAESQPSFTVILDATFRKLLIACLSISDGLSSLKLKIGNRDRVFKIHGVFLIFHKKFGTLSDRKFLCCLSDISTLPSLLS